MRKLIAALTVVMALSFGGVAQGHPSENRAEQAFFGGPHCHINVHTEKHAFPSHRAHIATGLPNTVFRAAPCP